MDRTACSYSRVVWSILLGILLLFLDFISKAYIYKTVPFCHPSAGISDCSIPVFYHFLGIDFSISLAINRGAAWGLFADFQLLLVVVRIVAIVGMLLYLLFFNRNRLFILPLVLIISGAIGNIVDFFIYGFVIDFLKFILWGYHFPVFNFADTCITIGVIWLFLVSYFKEKRHATY